MKAIKLFDKETYNKSVFNWYIYRSPVYVSGGWYALFPSTLFAEIVGRLYETNQ